VHILALVFGGDLKVSSLEVCGRISIIVMKKHGAIYISHFNKNLLFEYFFFCLDYLTICGTIFHFSLEKSTILLSYEHLILLTNRHFLQVLLLRLSFNGISQEI